MFITACGKLGWVIDNAREYVHPKPMVASVISEDRRTFQKGTTRICSNAFTVRTCVRTVLNMFSFLH